jgi:hypothetical protein
MALAIALPAPIEAPQRVLLPDPSDQQTATERLNIINPILIYKADAERFGHLLLKDGSRVNGLTRMVEWASESSGVSVPTLYRWLKRWESGHEVGLANLADKMRADKNHSRFFKKYVRAAWLADYLYLDPECKASVTVCHESLLANLDMVEVPAEDAPSYSCVRAYLNSLPRSLTVYAREGRKAYRERMSPYLKRGCTDVYSNQVWIGDHALHDVEVANDCFENVEWGAPIRVRLSAFIDYRSRMVTGATFCWEGSSRSIAACMRRGITKFGPPDHIYVDNGKDYRKAAKGAQRGCCAETPAQPNWAAAELASIEATGFMARLGIAVTHAIPHHPQSKAIERFFGTVHERFDSVWPTYTSGDPFTRPESTEIAMMAHRRLLKAGRVAESKHPLASRFILACLAWLEEYADTPHQGEGLDGQSPRQVFEQNRNPNQKPAPDHATLSLLMAEHETRRVRECAVTVAKHRYTPVDAAGWGAMHEYNEREVIVAYDSADLDAVAALDKDGNFLAWLEAEQLVKFAPWEPETQARIAESMQIRRRLEKGNRQTIELVATTARAMGAQSPLEAMAGRLRLSSGETGADVITQRKPKREAAELPAQPATPAQVARLFLEKVSQ